MRRNSRRCLRLENYTTKHNVFNPQRNRSWPNEKTEGWCFRTKFCTFCKRQGHGISNCYRWNPMLLSGLYHSQGTFYSDDQNHQKLFYTTAAPVDLDEWLVDSAATSHLCELREWFDYFKNLLPSDVLIGDKNC
ncbi:hypothetical protein AVEN_114528-1 [Araneus ventricosus]|uniref:Retrovirus-related Pol polyprotein from transposon TNT 1-94-like beta-barrel domain-containing protein n=1 Tax=Araneus ventricosus TaxID=182803 RepID=A0A4Y2QKP1_ARAVE|nr:hypothetical protein AVEN_114528-1 [Araneus ventricosus]